MNKQYIGDSVYVEIENDMIKLTTENGLGATNTIYLEWQVFNELTIYCARCLEEINEKREGRNE